MICTVKYFNMHNGLKTHICHSVKWKSTVFIWLRLGTERHSVVLMLPPGEGRTWWQFTAYFEYLYFISYCNNIYAYCLSVPINLLTIYSCLLQVKTVPFHFFTLWLCYLVFYSNICRKFLVSTNKYCLIFIDLANEPKSVGEFLFF